MISAITFKLPDNKHIVIMNTSKKEIEHTAIVAKLAGIPCEVGVVTGLGGVVKI